MKAGGMGIASLFLILVSCVSPGKAAVPVIPPEAPGEAPPVTVPAYQEVFYNGEAQPIDTAGAGEASLRLTYFPSEESLLGGEGGSAEAPSEVGRYFVKVQQPGEGFQEGRELVVEYRIQKAPVNIIARAVQEFRRDGREKPVAARADAPVPLTILYYDADRRGTQAQTRGPGAAFSLALPGPPSAPGHYLVRISFPGDSHYLAALKDVQLIIR
jgi:hypothetical protein